MTDYNVTVGKDLLPELLSGQDGLAKLIESVLNQVLEAQVSDSLGAERYERSEERVSYRMVIGHDNCIHGLALLSYRFHRHEMGRFQPRYLNAISVANKLLYWP